MPRVGVIILDERKRVLLKVLIVTIEIIALIYFGNIDLVISLKHVDYNFFQLDSLSDNLFKHSQKILQNNLNNKIY